MGIYLCNSNGIEIELKIDKVTKKKQYPTPHFLHKVLHSSARKKFGAVLFLLMSVICFCCLHEKSA